MTDRLTKNIDFMPSHHVADFWRPLGVLFIGFIYCWALLWQNYYFVAACLLFGTFCKTLCAFSLQTSAHVLSEASKVISDGWHSTVSNDFCQISNERSIDVCYNTIVSSFLLITFFIGFTQIFGKLIFVSNQAPSDVYSALDGSPYHRWKLGCFCHYKLFSF